ncbi:uncharacterized protein HMPREF1541_08045 [Cyphellophora europaea CBS 101466]|uniref:Phytanoyl-CoA dioxygenase n=1 Tax=Cyphellophora europaea (strain CBS 101466) TaxID=1220924 RepID=W2RL54_CYPE1|nr:uncharacterized protein HMPREF1541_08045 [Cyphellophora europaea CBS 101466]ETN37055.1 hypothetical protein HMPREF1541_08045 [Cyphellophora europaea CBS 101466]
MASSATSNIEGPPSTGDNPHRYDAGARIPSVDQHGDNPVTIRLSDEELQTGQTHPETVQQLLTYFHRDGFVVLENAIPDDLIDSLYTQMVSDNDIYLSKPFLQYNQGHLTKNISQIPPLTPKHLHRDFYANPHMLRVLENLLGPCPEIRFINSNVALPHADSRGRQAVHSDVNHRYPSIPFGIVVNTYLQDSDAANGVTEVWCGTHAAYDQDWQQVGRETGWIRKEAIQHRGRVRPPVQPRVRRGAMCIRDLRLWHAGMPNLSDRHRIMLAVDYFAAWYECPMKVRLPLSLKRRVEREWAISTKGIEWVDGEVDYLNQPFYLNMTQDPEMYIRQTEHGFEDWRARATGKYPFDRAKVTEQNYWTPDGQE